MKTLLTANLSTGTVKYNGSAWEPSVKTFGDSLTLALRFERDVEGQSIEATPNVLNIYAAVGDLDVRPSRGEFALHIGDDAVSSANTTESLSHAISAHGLQSAIADLPDIVAAYGAPHVVEAGGSLLIRFGSGAVQVPMKVVRNRLTPLAFGKIRAKQFDGEWVHELRLVVAPVAFTNAAERVLPPPPSIERVQSGGSDGGNEWNEIQALKIPPDFRGTFQFRRDYQRTGLLSRADGPDEIQELLSKFDQGFIVTNPVSGIANIEFGGDLGGMPHELLEVLVFNAPEGDWQFTLKLDRAELAARFRAAKEVTLPLTVKMIVDDGDGPTPVTAFTVPLTIKGELIFEELAEIDPIDWVLPPSPKDYVIRDPSTVITGQQHCPFVIGDGESDAITVVHYLSTRELSGIALYDTATGAALYPGPDRDYTYKLVNADAVEFSFPAPPAFGSVSGVITSAGPKSAFVDGLQINIPQVNNLDLVLENLGQRVSTLENLLPSTGAGATKGAEGALTITIPAYAETLFSPPSEDSEAELPSVGRYLLPAIHSAGPYAALPDPLPEPSSVSPQVYEYTGVEPLKIRIGGGVVDRRFPSIVRTGDYVACDGRALYPAIRATGTNSFYASIFDRSLFWFPITDRQHRVGRTMQLEFSVALQLLRATSTASWVLEIRTGTAPEDIDPAPLGLNLSNVVWAPTPIIQRRLLINELEIRHQFGVRIGRQATGMTLDVSEYGVWEGHNAAAPASATYLLQARMIQLDTENSQPTARGFVSYKVGSMKSSEQEITVEIS